jgi:mono/diheme cytochrome c family protein
LVPAGSTAQNVLAVSAAYGTVLAVTATGLVEVSNNVPTAVATLTQGAAGRSVAVDTNGDGWVLDQSQLAHFLTGKPVSYAGDVKPFFDKHCTVCHWTTPAGTTANSAPATDWDDYATAKSLAPLAILRMEGNGYTPMPPATANDPLTAADYAVVIRWVGGGYQP